MVSVGDVLHTPEYHTYGDWNGILLCRNILMRTGIVHKPWSGENFINMKQTYIKLLISYFSKADRFIVQVIVCNTWTLQYTSVGVCLGSKYSLNSIMRLHDALALTSEAKLTWRCELDTRGGVDMQRWPWHRKWSWHGDVTLTLRELIWSWDHGWGWYRDVLTPWLWLTWRGTLAPGVGLQWGRLSRHGTLFTYNMYNVKT